MKENLSGILNNLAMVGQLGLSLIMPVLMCMAACWLLTSRLGLGNWVYLPGFILGLGASGMTAYKTYLLVVSKTKKDGDRDRKAFNRHI